MTHYFFFKIHFSLTLYMTGIIWLIQVIHYPLFKLVGEHTFNTYHKVHTQKTSLVIAIPMLLEILTGLYLIVGDEAYRNNFIFITAFILLIFIWVSTFFISVPKHNILSKGFNDLEVNALIKTNWIRTIAWSIRAICLFYLLN